MASVLEEVFSKALSWGSSLAFPTICFWAISHFALGISPSYLVLCVYLELQLRVRRLTCGKPQEEAFSPAKLTQEELETPLRGIKVPTREEYVAHGQTLPPTKKVSTLYKSMPAGQECEYTKGRLPKDDVAEDSAWQQRLQCLREGAEVHREVRQYVQQKVRPGMELLEIAKLVEAGTSALVGFDAKHPLRRGWAFPTGLSLNEVAAHDTVNPGDPTRYLRPTDILKLDFGVQVQGHILDCAFSMAFDPVHDELMRAVQEATEEGIRNAGPDALTSEIGRCIREVMEAGEVHRPDGKVLRVKSIKNLTGHSIEPYKIHAGKSLPSVQAGGSVRMKAGELWAVETFGTVGGVGYVTSQGNCSHFMRPNGNAPSNLQKSALSKGAISLLDIIDRRFGTLAFCPRWIVQAAQESKSPLLKAAGADQRWWSAPLTELANVGVVSTYPPLADLPGSYTAQYEHTILLGNRGKEILTRGSDY